MTTLEKMQACPGWTAAGAVARGRDHKKSGTPSQDRCFRMAKNGCVATALCDGAGSRPFSHLAAARLSKEACRYLCGHFDMLYSLTPALARRKIFSALYKSLRSFARRKRIPFDQMACTLLATVVKENVFIAIHLGDGAIVRTTRRGPTMLTLPSNGMFANETYFLNNKANLRKMRIIGGELSDMTHGFILMSDGSATSLVSGKKCAPACTNITALVSRLPSSRSSKALRGLTHEMLRENTTDDCSLMVLCRTAPLLLIPAESMRVNTRAEKRVNQKERASALSVAEESHQSSACAKQHQQRRRNERTLSQKKSAERRKTLFPVVDKVRSDPFDYSTAGMDLDFHNNHDKKRALSFNAKPSAETLLQRKMPSLIDARQDALHASSMTHSCMLFAANACQKGEASVFCVQRPMRIVCLY